MAGAHLRSGFFCIFSALPALSAILQILFQLWQNKGIHGWAIMNTVSQFSFAIDSGVARIFDHIEDSGPMWAGSGKRWSRQVVTFSDGFAQPPTVQLSIAMIDADSARNLRLELLVEDVTTQGFTAVAHTWSDTRIGRLQVNWTALGNKNDAAWQV
ncbi:MAG: H-type lectin domain-containing protein [Pseudomonadota bacterium]